MRREYLIIGLILLVIAVTAGIFLTVQESERQTEVANVYIRLMTDCAASSGRSTSDCNAQVVPLIDAHRETIVRCHRSFPSPDAAFIACLTGSGIPLPY